MEKQHYTVRPDQCARAGSSRNRTATRSGRAVLSGVWLIALAPLILLGMFGCSDDECVNCPDQGPPAVPTGVFKINGDSEATIYWNDLDYPRSETLTAYRVYSRIYQLGDEGDPDRVFYLIGEVGRDENFDEYSGLHWFVDTEVENGSRYEYAVSSINAAGSESNLSYEFVVAAPLPTSSAPVEIFDTEGPNGAMGGFDFSIAALPGESGLVDPSSEGTTADVRVTFSEGIPYLHVVGAAVSIQDYGTFLGDDGEFYFDAVSWAPLYGYSAAGVLELIEGHVYIVEIANNEDDFHYAKLGVELIRYPENPGGLDGSVEVLWAYQLINQSPQLRAPQERIAGQGEHEPIEL